MGRERGAAAPAWTVGPMAVIAALAVAAGCSFHSVPPVPSLPAVPPAAFSVAARDRAPSERWWAEFGDAALDDLVGRALATNLDLRRAFQRMAQAEAAVRGARAGYHPQVTATAGAGRGRTFVSGMGEPRAVESNQFELSAMAAYEVDLWGRVGHLVDAAEGDIRATRDDAAAAAMSLAAQVAETWFGILEARSQLALLDAQIATNETYLELTTARFGQGLASALDVLQQRQQLAATAAQKDPLLASEAVLGHQLAVLLGGWPTAVAIPAGAALPPLPPAPEVGVPAALLTRRPDVRAAAARASAADHRVGAAIAARFPALRLSAGTGFRATDITQLFESWIWSILASVVGTAWDGGRLAAEVDRQQAVVAESLLAYHQAVLQAVREVEDALVREARQAAYLASLADQAALAEVTLAEARARYLSGSGDYLPVLGALQALHQTERAAVAARRQALSFRVQLYRALGGTWTDAVLPSLEPPAPPAGGDADAPERPLWTPP